MRFMQVDSGVPDHRVFTIDETSCRMLPVGDLGWGTMRAPARSIGDSRVQCTVTLAIPMEPGDMFAQVLFAGLTDEVIPVGPQPRGILVDHTHNHWQTVASLKAFLVFMDASVNKESPSMPWLCLLDAAPVHVAAEFLQSMRRELPWFKLCFVNPGTTALSQPLDRSIMRPSSARCRRKRPCCLQRALSTRSPARAR
jgi:hypothetical protein